MNSVEKKRQLNNLNYTSFTFLNNYKKAIIVSCISSFQDKSVAHLLSIQTIKKKKTVGTLLLISERMPCVPPSIHTSSTSLIAKIA